MSELKPKSVEKLSLSDLIGREKESNAELHQTNPEKRKWHEKYRTPRHRLLNLKGDEYTRPLASNPATDIRYHELAREFVHNGLDATKAYAAVYGVQTNGADSIAKKIFASSWMKSKIRDYLLGSDGEYDDLPREYLIERLMQMIDNNILDYIADDGSWLNVRELKALPEWAQKQIKKLNIVNETVPVALKNEQGDVVYDEDARPQYIDVRRQHITLELYDKQKAMEHLSKVMKWITTNVDITVGLIGADTMMKAESRVKQLRREDIEGKSERIASD